MTQLEKEIQADIVKLLETVGAAVYKIGTTRKKGDHQGTMQTPGIPDLVAFVPSASYLCNVSPHRTDLMGATLDRSEAAQWHDESGANGCSA